MSYPDLPERMGKVLHLVADRWEDGAHFERRITFGQDADFSGGVRAKFDGKMLSIEGEFSCRLQAGNHADLASQSLVIRPVRPAHPTLVRRHRRRTALRPP